MKLLERRHVVESARAGIRGDNLTILAGPAGVGKTAVATHIAKATERDRRVVWLSAERFKLTASGLIARPQPIAGFPSVLSAIAAASDRPDILRALPENRFELVRAQLMRVPTLLVVERLDLVTDDRIIGFLADLPSASSALATSNCGLGVGKEVVVPPLSRTAMSRVARRHAPDIWRALDAHQRDDLLELAQGLPAALIWSLAVARQDEDLAVALTLLRDNRRDLLNYCFTELWGALSDVGRVLLYAAATPTVGVSLADLELLSGESHRGVADATKLLRRRGLLERREGRFYVPGLAREYVLGIQGALDPPVTGVDVRYASMLGASLERSMPNMASVVERYWSIRPDALRLSERARSARHPALTSAVSAMWLDLAYPAFAAGDWDTLASIVAWLDAALADGGLTADAIGACCAWLLQAHRVRGDDGQRRVLLERVQDVANRQDDNGYTAAMVSFAASNDPSPGVSLESKLEVLDQAYLAMGRARDERWQAMIMNRRGNIALASGETEEARVSYSAALDICGRHTATVWGHELGSIASGNLGIVANREGNHLEALTLLEGADAGIAQSYDRATLWMEIAIANVRLGRRRAATAAARRSVHLAQAFGSEIRVAESDLDFEREELPSILRGRARTLMWGARRREMGRKP